LILSSPADPIAGYDLKARALAEQYETIAVADVHALLVDLVPRGPGLALDVGAGPGRDAAWLASLGHNVVAGETSSAMLATHRQGTARSC
jgi:protein-L-isoaspartate O-methyltransferase